MVALNDINEPQVTRYTLLAMQVCVPKDWTDKQVLEFAEENNPCGTQAGWQIRREGSPLLQGQPERRQCDKRSDCVHIVLDA